MNRATVDRQVSPVSALIPLLGTASAFVSLVGLGVVMGGIAMAMM